MKKKDKDELLDQLAQYGYALSVPRNPVAPAEVLEGLLSQKDVRLLEGFPVVLASVLSAHGAFPWEEKSWSPEKAFSSKTRERWAVLMGLSFLLFRLFGLPKEWEDRVHNLLKKSLDGEKVLASLEENFSMALEVRGGGLRFSTERLKNSFRNYMLQQDGGREFQKQKDAMEFELLLSELFTPRQKELCVKRLNGKSLTKTEREYYYRVVKKRLKALADERVCQMARKLVFS